MAPPTPIPHPPEGSPAGELSEEAERRVEEIAERYLADLRGGKVPERRAILAEHPDLADSLRRRLALVELMHRAAPRKPGDSALTLTEINGRRLRIRCPHCGKDLVLEEPSSLEVVCPDCGSSFQIADRAPPPRPAGLPARIGRFEVEGLLGRGAFGSVYLARDATLRRQVAIKVPRAGYFTTLEEEERFLREARSAAGLRHPGLVQVHEVGEENGVPYIVSEYIEGQTLADGLAAGRPGLREAAGLVAEVADALEYAHREKVIHRDIKPGNILLDSAGRPHLADFGLALQRDEAGVTVTLDGQILGTPAYMSPEQAAGDHRRVSVRSDVYSLGVVLYELITGERPFRGSKRMLVYQVLHDEPRPPRSLSDHIPRDLESICLRAMAKEPTRRYPSARALANDLRRFLAGEPILARPVGRSERCWRWCKRNPQVAALAGALACALLVVAVVSSVMALTTAQARDDANRQVARLKAGSGFRLVSDGDLFGSLHWFAEALRIDEGDPQRREVRCRQFEAALLHCPKLVQVWFFSPPIDGEVSRDGTRVFVRSTTGPGAWLLEAGGGPDSRKTLAETRPVRRHLFSPDGRLLVTCAAETAIDLWDTASGERRGETLSHPGSVQALAFAPDGATLYSGCSDGAARAWELPGGLLRGTPLHQEAPVARLAISPDGRLAATASPGGRIEIWDLATGARTCPAMDHGAQISHLLFSPDGRLLGAGGRNQTVSVWEVASGKKAGPRLGHGNTVNRLQFSKDGARLTTASGDGTAKVWDVQSWKEAIPTLKHVLGVHRAVFSPEGFRIITTAYDGDAKVWDASTGSPVSPPLHHGDAVMQAAFLPNGHQVITLSTDGTVRRWDLCRPRAASFPLRHRSQLSRAVFSPDGTRIATTGLDGQLKIWDYPGRGDPPVSYSHERPVQLAAFSPDGKSVLTAGNEAKARIWDLEKPEAPRVTFEHDQQVLHASYSPDGLRVATAGKEGMVRVWDAASGSPVSPGLPHRSAVNQASFHPSGSRVITAGEDGAAQIWDLLSGERVISLQHLEGVTRALFSPDGRRAATASHDKTARIWDAATGKPLTPPLAHAYGVTAVAFSPDGRRVATASYDATARIWDALTGAPVSPPLAHTGALTQVAFGPDGLLLVTASQDGTAQLWDVQGGEPVAPPFRHSGGVWDASFSPDGRSVLTASGDGTARVWTLPAVRRPPEDASLLARLLSGHRSDATGGTVRFSGDELQAAWEALRSRYPEEFSTAAGEDLNWHEEELGRCEDAGEWDAAVRHLDALIAGWPGQWELHSRRGYAQGERGRFQEAEADFRMVSELTREGATGLGRLADFSLSRGDRESYREVCKIALERLPASEPRTINGVAWVLALGPSRAADLSPVVDRFEKLLPSRVRNAGNRNTLGALYYRAGRYREARESLQAAMEQAGGGGTPLDWVFLAMTQFRLGNAAEARRWLDRVNSYSPGTDGWKGSWYVRIELEFLRKEAEELIGR